MSKRLPPLQFRAMEPWVVILGFVFIAMPFGSFMKWLATPVVRDPQAFSWVVQLIAAGGLTYFGIIWPALRWWRSKAEEPGHCRVCGYNLRTTRFRCPECGDVWMMHRER